MAHLASSNLHLPVLLATDRVSLPGVAQLLQPMVDVLSESLDAPLPCPILTISEQAPACWHPNVELSSASSTPLRGQSLLPLLDYAQTVQAGLIAVGWQECGIKNLSDGWATAIARYASCPVLIWRDGQNPIAPPSWNHVLLVVNASEAAQGAIALTRQLIPAGICRVTILCIQPPLNTHYLFGPFATPTPHWQLNQSLRQAQYEQSQRLAQQAEAALPLPTGNVQVLVQMSDPGQLICSVAQQSQADVIILGSDAVKRFSLAHYHPKFRPNRLTLVAEYVMRHAPCPLLLGRAIAPIAASRRFVLPKLKLRATAMAKPS